MDVSVSMGIIITVNVTEDKSVHLDIGNKKS